MINPTKSNRRIAKLADYMAEHWVFASIFKEAFIFGIPLLILRLAAIDDLKSDTIKKFDFMNNDSDFYVFIVVIIVIWRAAFSILTELFNKHREKSILIDTKKAFILLDQLEEPVNLKCRRFTAVLEQLLADNIAGKRSSKAAVFSKITQPEGQIFLLNKVIFEFFTQLFPKISKNKIKTRIALLSDNEPIKWQAFQPLKEGVPKTDIGELQGDSAITKAAVSKSIHIVEDIKKTKKKKLGGFKTTQSNTITKGSLICYPVVRVQTNDVPLVITIYSPTAGTFLESEKDAYEWLLARFASRLELESSLMDLNLNL